MSRALAVAVLAFVVTTSSLSAQSVGDKETGLAAVYTDALDGHVTGDGLAAALLEPGALVRDGCCGLIAPIGGEGSGVFNCWTGLAAAVVAAGGFFGAADAAGAASNAVATARPVVNASNR